MSRKTDAISRSDRVLVAALAIILATASAAVGSALTYRPATTAPHVAVVVKPAPVVIAQPVKAVQDSAMAQLLAEHRCLSEVLYYEARAKAAVGSRRSPKWCSTA